MNAKWVIVSATTLLLTACVVEPMRGPGVVVSVNDPYRFSPVYCVGCWYGQWGGRIGYHSGGGRPWEREHRESEHHGEDRGRDVMHDGHR